MSALSTFTLTIDNERGNCCVCLFYHVDIHLGVMCVTFVSILCHEFRPIRNFVLCAVWFFFFENSESLREGPEGSVGWKLCVKLSGFDISVFRRSPLWRDRLHFWKWTWHVSEILIGIWINNGFCEIVIYVCYKIAKRFTCFVVRNSLFCKMLFAFNLSVMQDRLWSIQNNR